MKKSTLSHLIGKSQHYVNIISKSRLFVDIFAMSSLCRKTLFMKRGFIRNHLAFSKAVTRLLVVAAAS